MQSGTGTGNWKYLDAARATAHGISTERTADGGIMLSKRRTTWKLHRSTKSFIRFSSPQPGRIENELFPGDAAVAQNCDCSVETTVV